MSFDSFKRFDPLTFLIVLGNEHSSHVELDVVPLLLGLKQVEWCSFGDKEHGLELELTFDREVFDSKVVLPVVTDGFVERSVLVLGYIGGVSIWSQLFAYVLSE